MQGVTLNLPSLSKDTHCSESWKTIYEREREKLRPESLGPGGKCSLNANWVVLSFFKEKFSLGITGVCNEGLVPTTAQTLVAIMPPIFAVRSSVHF